MTFCNDLEERLVWHLKASRRSLSAQELGAMLGISGRRVGAIVSHLRQEPHFIPILSNCTDGYSYPRRPGDEHETIANLRSRINEIERVIYGIEVGMQDMFEQQRLDLGEAV